MKLDLNFLTYWVLLLGFIVAEIFGADGAAMACCAGLFVLLGLLLARALEGRDRRE